jgi:hypothetical protein
MYVYIQTRKPSGKSWVCIPRGLPHFLDIPDMSESEYYHKTGPRWLSAFGMAPTIDDPLLIKLAETFKEKYGGMSAHDQTTILLSFVQQNVKYVGDEKRYPGASIVDDIWQFPATTIRDAKGDCEDSAFLFAGLAKLVGLDVIVVNLVGHVTCGVCTGRDYRLATYYEHNGKKYYDCDGTSAFGKIGLGSGLQLENLHEVVVMDELYKNQIYSIEPI